MWNIHPRPQICSKIPLDNITEDFEIGHKEDEPMCIYTLHIINDGSTENLEIHKPPRSHWYNPECCLNVCLSN